MRRGKLFILNDLTVVLILNDTEKYSFKMMRPRKNIYFSLAQEDILFDAPKQKHLFRSSIVSGWKYLVH